MVATDGRTSSARKVACPHGAPWRALSARPAPGLHGSGSEGRQLDGNDGLAVQAFGAARAEYVVERDDGDRRGEEPVQAASGRSPDGG